jgi:hypothetical protein
MKMMRQACLLAPVLFVATFAPASVDAGAGAVAASLVEPVLAFAQPFIEDIIYAVSHQPPYMYQWTIDTRKDSQTLYGQDGDRIVLTRTRNPDPHPHQITIRMKQPGTWWKAVTLHRGSSFMYEANWLQDSTKYNQKNVLLKDWAGNNVVLSKAKAFGVHTNIYWIRNAYNMDPAYIWEFDWQKD